LFVNFMCGLQFSKKNFLKSPKGINGLQEVE
jgi:hypothetical protein